VAEESTETVLPANGRNRRSSRWYPLDVFEAVQDEMDRFWRQLGLESPGSPRSRFRRGGWPATAWSARMDVFEKDNTVIVNLELPGLKKEDVQIELTDGALVIRGRVRQRAKQRQSNITGLSGASAPSIAS
jgi:HSP20 family molecular chaperone IbpA